MMDISMVQPFPSRATVINMVDKNATMVKFYVANAKADPINMRMYKNMKNEERASLRTSHKFALVSILQKQTCSVRERKLTT